MRSRHPITPQEHREHVHGLPVPTKTVKGTFTDPRDGKVYKTVKIGKQVWFAENLNFDCEGSKCYSPPKNAEKYGRLYDWETAKKACPSGWHLPSNEEWDGLVDFAGGEKIAGKKLKAESGWNENGNGTDDYGFSALPGGYGFSGCFGNIGSYSYWWSANEDNSGYAYFWYMHYQDGKVGRHNNNKSYLHSVRCVQDKVLPKGISRGKKK